MRIALIHYTAPPIIGGVERILSEQAALFCKHGHSVQVISGNTAQILTALQPLHSSCDIIIVHNVFTMPFDLELTRSLRELAQKSPARWINWVHDVAAVNPHYAHLPWEKPEYQMLRQAPPNCTHVAVSDVRQLQYHSVTKLHCEQIHIVPNGVDVQKILGLTDRVSDWTSKYRLWEKDFVLIHPTRLVRRKNIELGLQITAALSQRKQLKVSYLITGAPDPHNPDSVRYGQELRELIAKLGIQDSAHFLGDSGPLTDDDVRGLYAVSDALLFPSLSEGFGLPVVEAALHGLPVFCSDIPAHREIGQSVANFFDLDEDPGLIAFGISEHPAVTARYLRRSALASWLDWDSVMQRHLLPLLQLSP